jgi:inhibitor of KinA sporulation pathway (predicted exonuclease)
MPVLDLPPDPELAAWPARGLVAILDLEFTSWDGSLERAWSEPWEWREIVQIGALIVDAARFAPRDELEILVKPQRNPILSDYFQKLTGITQTEVDAHGVSFVAAVAKLEPFLASAEVVIFNGHDGQILRENCAFNGVIFPLPGECMFDFRPLLASTLSLPHQALVSSGLPRLADIEVNGRAHSGLHDCHAIAASLGHWRTSGVL